MAIAVIGFGTMGRAAAEALLAAGRTVFVADPHAHAESEAARVGATFASSTASAGAAADVVLLFLPGPEQIRAVVTELGQADNTITVVDHSTADPATAQDASNLLTDRGHHWIDAPVLGRPAAVGRWTLPVGQSEGALSTCRDVLGIYSSNVVEVGGPGAGHTVKLLNQMMFGAINAMTAEMMAASARIGLDPARLIDILTSSRAGTVSNLFVELGARIADDVYDDPAFSVRLLEKDVRLAIEMAEAAGANTSLGRVIASFNEQALEQGLAEQDTAAMWTSRP